MPSATPQIPHGTPINRPVPTPRMTQASPPPGMAAHGSPIGQNMHMGHQNMGQPMTQQQMIMAQQARQRAIQHQQNQQLQQAMQNNMINGQNPQLQQQQQQQLFQQQQLIRQQMMLSGQGQGMLNPAQQAQLRYQAAQQVQMQGQMQGAMAGQMPGSHMGNQTFANMNGMNPTQVAMMQHLQQRGQVRTPMNMQQMNMQQIRVRQQQLYQSSLPNLINQFGGENMIPPDVMEKFRQSCLNRASQDVARIRQMQIQQQQQQHQQAVQQAAQQQQHQQQQLAQQNDMGNMGMMQQGM